MLNDRPLTYLSSDVSDEEPLTPSHLLYGRRITVLPYPVIDKEEINDPDYSSSEQLRRRACQQALLFQTFWHRWKHDYLTYLREFHRTSGNNQQKIKVRDVVLVHDDSPRRNWKLAVIEDLHKGGDGLVRAADIRTSRGRTNRPIIKLYPLEVSADDGNVPAVGNMQTQGQDDQQIQCPVRVAAQKAKDQISEWARTLCSAPEDVED